LYNKASEKIYKLLTMHRKI